MKKILYLGLLLGILYGGVMLGMLIQQGLFIIQLEGIFGALDGANIDIEVGLNESKLVEGFKEGVFPILNQTIVENKRNIECEFGDLEWGELYTIQLVNETCIIKRTVNSS